MEDNKVTEKRRNIRHIRHYAKAKKLLKEYYGRWRKNELTKWDGETDEQFAARKAEHMKDCEKSEKRALRFLENADRAGRLREIEAEINWGKGRGIYGYQCRARVWVSFEDEKNETNSSYVEGPRTNGYGYDKPSTALSDAFMNLDEKGQGAIDRFVIEAGPKVWEEYAIETRPYPHFCFGGKGMTTFTRLFHRLGNRKYKDSKFPFPKFEIDDRQNANEDYFIHVIRRDLV